MKTEQRKVRGLEWGPQVKQTALLASPVNTGQVQKEETKYIKKRSQNWASLFFWVAPYTLGMYFLCLPSKTELYPNCYTGLTFQIFAAARQNWGNYTLPWQSGQGKSVLWVHKQDGVLCDVIMQITSYYLCHILLARSKLQVLNT